MFDNLCTKCNQEAFDTYIPTEKEIEDFRAIFPEFYKKHHYALNRSWWMLYYPKYLKILTVYFERKKNFQMLQYRNYEISPREQSN